MDSLTVKLVIKDGAVDQSASEAAFRTALLNFVAQRETEQSTIADVVSSIFDTHKGAKITMPTIANMVCAQLNAQPENWSALNERALGYVRANSKGDDSLFVVAKGKNGGVARRSDLPVAAPESK